MRNWYINYIPGTNLTTGSFALALSLFYGAFSKLVIADRIAIFVNSVFDNYTTHSGTFYIIAVFLYTFQIYADFSGGMDIATGVSEMMGIKLVKNFNRPYLAKSISEFWNRWHITLGRWMKDYIFYPLCLSKMFSRLGKKCKKIFGKRAGRVIPTCIASFFVFFLIGIWHGASWKYVAFGFYHGFFIMSGILLEPVFEKINKLLHIPVNSTAWKIFQCARTFLITFVGRYFSRAESLSVAFVMMKESVISLVNIKTFSQELFNNIFGFGLDIKNFIVLILSLILLLVIGVYQEKGHSVREFISMQKLPVRWAVYYCVLFFVLIFGVYGMGFESTAFIYKGF